MIIGGIYSIVQRDTGRVYIGSTRDFHTRFRKHRSELMRGTHGNSYLQRAWNKYGAEAFEFRSVEMVSDIALLPEREQAHLDVALLVFNLGTSTDAPRRGVPLSPEHKAKIGAANKGRVVSAETRSALSAALKGRTLTREWIDKSAAARRGLKRSPETCERMRAGNIGKHHLTAENKAKAIAGTKAYFAQLTDEQRRVKAANMGGPKSAAHKAKLAAHLNRVRPDQRGSTRTPETRARMVEAARLSWANGKRRLAQKAA